MAFDSFGAAVGFALAVAPGIVWTRRIDKRRPSPPQSSLVEAGWIALSSAIFSLMGLALVLGGVRLTDADAFDDLVAWVSTGAASANVPVIAGIVLLAELPVALALAWLADEYFGPRLIGPRRINDHNQWDQAVRYHDVGFDNPRVIATVSLDDGSVFRGDLEFYSLDLPMDDREITLITPIVRVTATDAGEEVRQEVVETRLVLPGARIASVGFIYTEHD